VAGAGIEPRNCGNQEVNLHGRQCRTVNIIIIAIVEMVIPGIFRPQRREEIGRKLLWRWLKVPMPVF
jgi:hypothetical protein